MSATRAAARCNICGGAEGFGPPADLGALTVPADDHLREGLPCATCGAISRDRAVVLALAGLLGEQAVLYRLFGRDLPDLLTEAGFTAVMLRLVRPDRAIAGVDVVVAAAGGVLGLSSLRNSHPVACDP